MIWRYCDDCNEVCEGMDELVYVGDMAYCSGCWGEMPIRDKIECHMMEYSNTDDHSFADDMADEYDINRTTALFYVRDLRNEHNKWREINGI